MTYGNADEETEKKALAYLEMIAQDGLVHETVHTTIAEMGWKMTE